MKKLLFILIAILSLIILPFIAYSQIIVKENKIWSVAAFASEGNTIRTTHTSFISDTTINDKHYRKIGSAYSFPPLNWHYTNRYIREDSNRVYCYLGVIDLEYIMYDFNLMVGDTFYSQRYDITFTVDTIISKDIQGRMLKHWYLTNPIWEMTWIENVGSYYGATEPFGKYTAGAILKLLCITENGELVYDNPDYNSCHLTTTSVDLLEKRICKLIDVYSTDNEMLYINSNEYYGEIIFYTMEGKQILKQEIKEIETKICLPYKGIAIYQFNSNNGEEQKGKIIFR